MALRIRMVTIDCLDTHKLAEFWVAALGAEIIHEVDDGDMLVLASEGNVDIGLQRVDELREGKNRLHIDLGAPDRPAEVARLVALGATVVEEHTYPGMAWSVLRDPEGNEFCVGSRNG
ncbi:VOC family protein [Kutzneria kofuensis]|uniref:Putative enzyme related to lactoylglutathione lyase n=1 Tax=Kutzneria kofuensis TaxID=103725 RepID=A0A7W9NG55_9PSEU|nr:VOC family protein [Kutzneria kofuensis]MBB5890826.1 putative enzyme related to lactoylglutathione lyase [Kutzneria kofuensis]